MYTVTYIHTYICIHIPRRVCREGESIEIVQIERHFRMQWSPRTRALCAVRVRHSHAYT